MPITLTKKNDLVNEISQRLDENQSVLLVNTIGLTVAEVSAMRRKLREQGIYVTVYKNRLIRRAIEQKADNSEYLKLVKHLKGATALALTKDDPVVAAKLVTDCSSENEKFGVKAAVCENSYFDLVALQKFAKLGSKTAVYGKLIATMKAPLYKLVFVLNAPGSKLVGTLKAIAEK